MNPIELGIFSSRIESVCDEMGAMLKRAAFSPNIKDRLDFSCAVFDDQGGLCAQAAHIPVHLGSMAYAMADIVSQLDWQPGDMVVLNDPYKGGTHLPDVTLVAPVFVENELLCFVANRAHHANIGGSSPGSMPISSHLDQEGILIEPSFIIRKGNIETAIMSSLCRESIQAKGDFSAQISANLAGVERLALLIENFGVSTFKSLVSELNAYGRKLALSSLESISNGRYEFEDYLDDDGQGTERIKIRLSLSVTSESPAQATTPQLGSEHSNAGDVNEVCFKKVILDFTGTDPQVPGNINCPLSVAAAAAFYVFRCLMPPQTPACAGTFSAIEIQAPKGCLLNAQYPAAVAAGNVETSTRIVDVVLGALAQAIPDVIPAASHGSMNNVAMGAEAEADYSRWDYYETIGGGMGASANGDGLNAVQTHMTNTLNTPIESLELHYPLRVTEYGIRHGSGGSGDYAGGEGIVREIEFLRPAQVTLLTERRVLAPWGNGNRKSAESNGQQGLNLLNGEALPGKTTFKTVPGDRLRIETPGGGGYIK